MPPLSRFFYLLQEFDDDEELEEIQDKFNALGDQGWEIVSFDGTTALFKKRKQGLD